MNLTCHKYNDGTTGTYRDGQGTGAISEGDHRDLVTDIKDSFQNKIDNLITAAVISAGAVALNFSSENGYKNFALSPSGHSGALAWSIAGSGVAEKFTAMFHHSASGVHTLPASFKMSHPDWNSVAKTFTIHEAGYYKMNAHFNGLHWFAEVMGPYE